MFDSLCGVELLEHWWNGLWGRMTRRDVFVRHNPAGLWEVEHRQHGRSRHAEFVSLEAAQQAAAGLCTGLAEWKRLDHLHR